MRPIPLLAAAVAPWTHRLPPGFLRRGHDHRASRGAASRRAGSEAAGAAAGELAIRLHLAHRTRRPRVLIDGHLWEEVRWIVTPNGDGWNAVAVLGLEHLPVGRHEIRIEPPGHPVTTLGFRHLPS
jgi:hypothetical protein